MKTGKLLCGLVLLALISVLFAAAAGAADVALDEQNFPDDVFRGYVEVFDTDHDGVLSDAERDAVTDINCDGMDLESVLGIEFFEKLETLSLKNCASLKYLPGNLGDLKELVSITLDGCTALKQINLDPSGKALMNLSARDCTALTYCRLWWNYENKPVLDLSGCTALETIDGYTSYFSAIKVDQCTSLTTVRAGGSGKLDLSTCPEIRYIELDKAGSQLNLKNCSKLEELHAAFGLLIGGLDLSDCVSLKKLSVGYCDGLDSLDVTNCPELEILSCGNNHDITSLDVTHNTKLKGLYCHLTGITSLDLRNCTELTELECGDQLTALDVSQNTKLQMLNCGGNDLTSLDVSMLPELTVLYCGGNQLSTLDVTHNPKLKQLYCGNNGLTELDVTHNPELEDLFCHDNDLTALDVRKTPYLNQHVLKGDVIIETGYPDYGKHVQYLYKGAKYENGVKVDKDVHINTAHCTILWYDWDGTLLEDDAYFPVGIVPVYPNSNPTREADAQYTYTFDGWTPEPGPAKEGETKYTAVYKEKLNSYKIAFVNWDGTELDYDWFDYGETPVYTGETPTRDPDSKYSYTFSGWTPELVPVTGEATYTAVFEKTENSFNIRFLDEDGTLLQSGTVASGVLPVYTGPTPVKEGDDAVSWTFAGWTPKVVPVTEDADYTAVFVSENRLYTVTWIIGGRVEKETWPWGSLPQYANPVMSAKGSVHYTFRRWDPVVQIVTGDAVYTAVFDEISIPVVPLLPDPHKPAVPEKPAETVTPPVIVDTPVSLPFTDVMPASPFYDDIVYVWDNGIMNGMSAASFGENLPLTRGMIVTVLWRMEGCPAAGYAGTFTDVPAGEWFTEGVEWAASRGIVLGYGNGKYGPGDEVTREQLAAILYRYAIDKKYDVSVGEDTNILSYDDAFDIASWAYPAMQWACGSGVLNSAGTAAIRPADPATRGEIAHAIRAFLEAAAE